MEVLINTSPLKTASAARGIGRYVSELVKSLQLISSGHKFYTSDDRPKSFDLIHFPFFDLFFPTLPVIRKKPTVVTIHDVIPLIFKKHYPVGIRGKLAFLYQKLSLRSVSQIITDSEASKRDIAEHLKVHPDKITVVPLAASEAFVKKTQAEIEVVRKKYELPKNYVLYVGDINYNKNLPFLIMVMARIPDITLVLVGRAMANTKIPEGLAIKKAIDDNGSAKFVRLVTNLESQEELAAMYSGARAYVQPSLYEGFGLPVIEAMRCKTPVVASKGGSLPEVLADNGFLFHPRDPEECEAAIRKALRMSPETRATLVKRAYDYSQQFTWERTARETLSVYEKAVK